MRVLRRKKTFTRALNCIFLFVKSQEEMFKKMYRISNIPNLTMARFEIDLEERKRHEHSCGGLKYVSSISLFIAKILQMRTRCYAGVNHLCCVQTLIGVTFFYIQERKTLSIFCVQLTYYQLQRSVLTAKEASESVTQVCVSTPPQNGAVTCIHLQFSILNRYSTRPEWVQATVGSICLLSIRADSNTTSNTRRGKVLLGFFCL